MDQYGPIKARKSRDQRTRKYPYLLRKDVEAIVKTQKATLNVRQAAALLGTNTWNVDQRIQQAGMRAVSGPKVDGFETERYLRSDVQILRRRAQQVDNAR